MLRNFPSSDSFAVFQRFGKIFDALISLHVFNGMGISNQRFNKKKRPTFTVAVFFVRRSSHFEPTRTSVKIFLRSRLSWGRNTFCKTLKRTPFEVLLLWGQNFDQNDDTSFLAENGRQTRNVFVIPTLTFSWKRIKNCPDNPRLSAIRISVTVAAMLYWRE